MTQRYLTARNALASLLSQAATQYGTREEQWIVTGADKSINEVSNDYRNQLTNFSYDAMNGRMGAADMSRAMRSLMRGLADDVYIEGMREGGIVDDEGELSAEDEAAIAQFLASQLPYVRDFADACVDVRDESNQWPARALVLGRVELWVSAFEGLGQLGALNARGNPFLTFNGVDGAESCAECQKQTGKRHRKSTWERRGLIARDGNENYSCGRWEPCQHHFYYDDGSLALD